MCPRPTTGRDRFGNARRVGSDAPRRAGTVQLPSALEGAGTATARRSRRRGAGISAAPPGAGCRGASEVQIDEPCLVLDRTARELDAFADASAALHSAAAVELCLATYFDGLDGAGSLERVLALTMARSTWTWCAGQDSLRRHWSVSTIDRPACRSAWWTGETCGRTDLDAALRVLDTAWEALGSDRITIAPSCSLLHVPYDASREGGIDPSIRRWLAFAAEKLGELRTLAGVLDVGPVVRARVLASSREVLAARRASPHATDPDVRAARRDVESGRLRAECSGVEASRHPTRARWGFRRCRRPRSAPSRRPLRSGRCARRLRTGKVDQGAYDRFLKAEIGRVHRDAGRRWAWTCWSRRAGAHRHGRVLRRAARRASPSPSSVGCSPTAAGA